MQRPVALAVFFLLGTPACGPEGTGGGGVECEANLLAGDLVISEVMANPDGDDAGKEYFEVFNASGETFDLTGMTLVYSREDLSGEGFHALPEIVIEPGEYYVFGGVLHEFRDDYVDYGYGNAFEMRNGGARLALQCGEVEVDSMVYPEMADQGVSYGLNGGQDPDATANDDPSNLCPHTLEFAPGLFGSPGEPNEACEVVVPGQCEEGGEMREVVAPAQGDLVITELMPNPDGGGDVADADGEWFEVLATADVDINGLGLGSGDNMDQVQSSTCISLAAGEFALFARSADSEVNGGLPEVDGTFGFNLGNSGGDLFVEYASMKLDAITWSGSGTGESIQLTSSALDPVSNDDESNFCDGTMDYGNGDLGTPKADNEMCPVICDEGMCFDGDSCRAPNPPIAADVTITEFMPKPAAAVGSSGEWIEVQFAAEADLNGVSVEDANENPNPIMSQNCVTVGPNAHVVFARSLISGDNGELPAADHGFTFQLNDTGDTITVRIDTTVLDEVVYTAGAEPEDDVQEGVARQIDDSGDECFSSQTYGTPMQNGSPGDPNPDC